MFLSAIRLLRLKATIVMPDLVIKTSHVPWALIANEFEVLRPEDLDFAALFGGSAVSGNSPRDQSRARQGRGQGQVAGMSRHGSSDGLSRPVSPRGRVLPPPGSASLHIGGSEGGGAYSADHSAISSPRTGSLDGGSFLRYQRADSSGDLASSSPAGRPLILSNAASEEDQRLLDAAAAASSLDPSLDASPPSAAGTSLEAWRGQRHAPLSGAGTSNLSLSMSVSAAGSADESFDEGDYDPDYEPADSPRPSFGSSASTQSRNARMLAEKAGGHEMHGRIGTIVEYPGAHASELQRQLSLGIGTQTWEVIAPSFREITPRTVSETCAHCALKNRYYSRKAWYFEFHVSQVKTPSCTSPAFRLPSLPSRFASTLHASNAAISIPCRMLPSMTKMMVRTRKICLTKHSTNGTSAC